MKLIHIYIKEHKAVRNLNISVGGEIVCNVQDQNVDAEYRVDTCGYYKGYHCSAIIGANGVGKSSILDFLETVYFPTDSSGVLVFLDCESRIHICQINYDVLYCPLPFNKHDNYEVFAKSHKVSLVKINNVSAAQSKLGYAKKFKHSLIQERSLEQYTASNRLRKKYFDNLIDYLRWNQADQNAIHDVGFEFKIQSSFRKLEALVRPDVYDENCRRDLMTANGVVLEKMQSRIQSGRNSIYDYLIEALCTSIIVELAAISGGKRSLMLAVMHVYFMKALSTDDLNFSRSISHALEALRYEENWQIFSETSKNGRHPRFSSIDVDVDKIQATYSEYLQILRDIAECLCLGRISIEENGALVVLIDDFTPASKVVYLASRLPRNILSNINWGWRGISTGEMAYAHLFSETYNCSKKSGRASHIILIDEADLYLHPEWQRSFLNSYLELLDRLDWGRSSPQIVITTHSPIIVSDFLPQDITSLAKNNKGKVEVKKSLGFGTNITSLFIDGMHLTATVGEHSRKVIVSLVKKAESQNLSSLDKELIKKMGNKFVREYLLKND
ncbi:AAA family ATPase [Pseudomonas sp. LjRoot277]|uniref:AAA family ATPase n=1 Tax=Pseudomonas sp. LjRoot277 TaxID=3342307 RepID=UPI003ECD47D7